MFRLCLVCVSFFVFCVNSSSQLVVLQIAIDDYTTLTLFAGDCPCKVLQDTCRNASQGEESTYDACFSTAHPLLTRQLTASWRHISSKLAIDPTIFLDCKQADFDHKHYDSLRSRDSLDQTMEDLLDILRGNGGEKAAREFDVRRNDVRMTEEEQAELYLRAILLEPNHPLIVGQCGVALIAVGREDLARALFADAVRRGIWENEMQRPLNYYVPGLTSKPWYDANEFPFTAVIRQGYEDIRKELIANIEGGDLFYVEAENRNSYSFDGSWKTLIVKERHTYTDLAKRRFPKTIEWLEKCKEDFLLVKFSALDPGTHIHSHSGPSNERLRSHFTLIHSGGAKLRVNDEWRSWKEGEVVVFDSSWEHEVVHQGTERRIILILDIWHPDYLNGYSDGH